MAVATKTAPAAKTEQRRKSAPVSRGCRKRRSAMLRRTILCALGMISLLCYVGLYAQVTLYSYHKSDLARQTRQIEMENQALRAEIQMLSSPERLAAVAVGAGMLPGSDVIYIYPDGGVKVAKAD